MPTPGQRCVKPLSCGSTAKPWIHAPLQLPHLALRRVMRRSSSERCSFRFSTGSTSFGLSGVSFRFAFVSRIRVTPPATPSIVPWLCSCLRGPSAKYLAIHSALRDDAVVGSSFYRPFTGLPHRLCWEDEQAGLESPAGGESIVQMPHLGQIFVGIAVFAAAWTLSLVYISIFYHRAPGPQRNHPSSASQAVALLVMGEGLQNNHHAYPASARFSTRIVEPDFGYALARVLAALRVIEIRRELLIPAMSQSRTKTATGASTATGTKRGVDRCIRPQ